MACIYGIIQSVPFWSVFPTLFTRHYSQYSSSFSSAMANELGQTKHHVYKVILTQATPKQEEFRSGSGVKPFLYVL